MTIDFAGATDRPKRYRLFVDVEVTDPQLLHEYAARRTRESFGPSTTLESLTIPGGDEDDLTMTAIAEALINSNENPSPDTYGIEILRTEANLL